MEISQQRISSFEWLHPVYVKPFINLYSELKAEHTIGEIPFIFEPFETYRTPMRQNTLLAGRSSFASAYRSAHQFGLAVDFVPVVNGKWTWDVEVHWWNKLKGLARKHGLDCPITWDKCHVEHPVFDQVRRAMWP